MDMYSNWGLLSDTYKIYALKNKKVIKTPFLIHITLHLSRGLQVSDVRY